MIRYSYKNQNGKEYYIDNIGLFIDKEYREKELKESFENFIYNINLDLKNKKIKTKEFLKELKTFFMLSNNYSSLLHIESSTNYYMFLYDLNSDESNSIKQIKTLIIDPSILSFYFIDQVDLEKFNIKKFSIGNKKMICQEYNGLIDFSFDSELEMNETIKKIKELS